MVDKRYCMSSFLMFRTIADHEKSFSEKLAPKLFSDIGEKEQIHDSFELEDSLRRQVQEAAKDGKAALALSGGMDSLILAKFMPKGSKAYTFRCRVPGIKVVDESERAAEYAAACGLEHEIIDIYWEDMEELAPVLMRHKGAPIHSIEVQIYKAARKAKADGFNKFIFGESADVNYGGFSGLLSRDWLFGEFVDRYSYVLPYAVLQDPEMVLEPYREACMEDGCIDVHNFCRTLFRIEAMGTYTNAVSCVGGMNLVAPYNNTWMAVPLDYERVRKGENKYLIREVYARLYPDKKIPDKIPMPRPVNEWLASWEGPKRPEFLPNCVRNMSGDQKWIVYSLEVFLNLLDEIAD